MPRKDYRGDWIATTDEDRKKESRGLFWFVVWVLTYPLGSIIGEAIDPGNPAAQVLAMGAVYVGAMLLLYANRLGD